MSLERVIEQNKERYYETLQSSSSGWHEGKHNPFIYINFPLFILKEAYKEFEARIGQTKDEKGAKEALVRAAVRKENGEFKLADIEQVCPGVGRDWIRVLLRQMKTAGELISSGRGPGARWKRTSNKGSTL